MLLGTLKDLIGRYLFNSRLHFSNLKIKFLDSIEDKHSRFTSGEQFHFMVTVSFYLEIKFKENSFFINGGSYLLQISSNFLFPLVEIQ